MPQGVEPSEPVPASLEWEVQAEQREPVEEEVPADAKPVDPHLKRRALGSLFWVLAGFGTLQILRFGFNLVLTRLLLPEVFGLLALVDLFILGLHMFADVGLSVSIVQGKRGDDPHYLNTAWSLQVVRGFYLWLGACLLAWPVAVFYQVPQLLALLPVAGLTAVVNGFNSIAMFTAERHLSQGRLTLLQLVCYVVSTSVVLACLLLTPMGVWAMIVGRLAGSVLELILSYGLLHGPRCRFTWDRAVLAEIIEFGKWIFLSTACTFLAEQVDRLIVGSLASLATFGIYNLAVQLSLAGKQAANTITSRIAFPYSSRRFHQGVDLATIFHEVHPWTAGFGAFVTAGLISAGPTFIHTLFKPDYAPAAWMLQLVAVCSWISMLQLGSSNLLWLLGRPRSHALGMAVKLLTAPACAWVGYRLSGVAGMIAGFGMAELLRYGVTLWALRRYHLSILRYDLLLSMLLYLSCHAATRAGDLVAGPEEGPTRLIVIIATTVLLWAGLAGGVLWRKRAKDDKVTRWPGDKVTELPVTPLPRHPVTLSLGSLVLGGLVMAATAMSAAGFLRHQSLWNDETTQLAGLGLGPVQIVDWLCDPNGMDLGVPGDRMPPLSYWVGQTWSRLFGLSEPSLRWFGICCATLASGMVFRGVRRVFGLAAAFVAGALFAFSPNVCYYAVEIRAYPLFLLTSAGALDAFLGLQQGAHAPRSLDGRERLDWILLTLWLVLGVWTHYFGLVLAGALLLALLRLGWGRPQQLRLVLSAAGVVAACLIPLVPFVRGAASIPDPPGPEALTLQHRWYEALRLLYHLLGHPTLLVWGAPLIAGVFGSAAVLLGTGLLARPEARPALHGLRLALFAGLAVMIGASFLVRGFSSAKYTYAVWALPLVFALLGGGLTVRFPGVRTLAGLAAVVLLGCEVAATGQLWVHGDYFAHSPYRKLRVLYGRMPRDRVAIVYEGEAAYISLFYPIQYAEGRGLAQYVPSEGGPVFGGSIPLENQPDQLARLNDYRWLVVVNVRREGAAELARQVNDGDEALGTGPVLQSLEQSGGWRRVDHRLYVSLVAAEVVVLQQRH